MTCWKHFGMKWNRSWRRSDFDSSGATWPKPGDTKFPPNWRWFRSRDDATRRVWCCTASSRAHWAGRTSATGRYCRSPTSVATGFESSHSPDCYRTARGGSARKVWACVGPSTGPRALPHLRQHDAARVRWCVEGELQRAGSAGGGFPVPGEGIADAASKPAKASGGGGCHGGVDVGNALKSVLLMFDLFWLVTNLIVRPLGCGLWD